MFVAGRGSVSKQSSRGQEDVRIFLILCFLIHFYLFIEVLDVVDGCPTSSYLTAMFGALIS